MLRLSIITVNLNDVNGLEKTMKSVWGRQTFDDFEHIVIDGGSKDGSVDIIKRYENKLSYWISEPDAGIYNAMNKGIVRAKGEYLLFINGGDWLADDVLAEVFSQSFDDDIVLGNFTYVKNDGTLLPYIYKRDIGYVDLLIYSIGHPSSFIKRSLFNGCLYNEEFRIVSDWAFFVTKVIKERCSIRRINVNIAFFNTYGISIKPETAEIIEAEHNKFLEDNFDPCFVGLYHSAIRRENTFDYLTERRTKEFLDSNWIKHHTRKCIKALFWIRGILGVKH